MVGAVVSGGGRNRQESSVLSCEEGMLRRGGLEIGQVQLSTGSGADFDTSLHIQEDIKATAPCILSQRTQRNGISRAMHKRQ